MVTPRSTAALLAIVTATACDSRDRDTSAAADSAAPAEAAPATASVALKLPDGFTATVFATDLGSARHLVVASNGDVYVNTRRSRDDTTRRVPEGGYTIGLRDTTRDGKADVIQRFGATPAAGSFGGTGIALRGEALYVEADSSIVRYRLTEGALVPAAAADTIVTGLVTEDGHTSHPIAVDAKGNLFVNVGSATNSCQEQDRQRESPGIQPCRELQTRGGIWRFNATRTGQRFSPGARYATGIRNAGALAIHPEDGILYATQHGRDQLGENWSKLFDWKESASQPAEELLRVERGADYGWPYCYFDSTAARLVLAPEYGGDGKKVGQCGGKRGPAAAFPAHWAPNGLAFYAGSAFPPAYRGGAFIAFHGSWNRAPEPQEGYNVVFQPMAKGKASGRYQVFADGFAGAETQPGSATHRPAGVAVAPDGALYITDDQRGTVWRVTYSGS